MDILLVVPSLIPIDFKDQIEFVIFELSVNRKLIPEKKVSVDGHGQGTVFKLAELLKLVQDF